MNKENHQLRSPIVTVCGHVDHGKCVAGETLIPLYSGEIKAARDIFNEHFESDKAVNIEDGIFQDISKKGIKISSFDGEKIVEKSISHIWRRKADKLIEVKIASGDIIKTTPEHLFLVFCNEVICEKRADLLSEEDYIVFPKFIKTADAPLKGMIIERIKRLENFVCFVNNRFNLVFKELSKRGYKNIERKLSIKNLSWNVREGRFKVKELFLIGYYLGISDEDIYSTISTIKNSSEKWRAGHTSKEVALPSMEDPEALGYILGCLAGDGHLTKTNVILNNNDEDVQGAYKQNLKKVFSLDSTLENKHTCQTIKDNGGRTFTRIISDIFDIPIGNKSAIIKVPEIVKRNKEVFKGFFAGWFDTDGYVSHRNNSIEMTSKSRKIVKECSGLLLNFGILSSIYDKNGFYYLGISNKECLRAFLENIKPRLGRKLERIIKAYEKSQSSRIFDVVPVDKRNFKSLKFHGKKNRVVPYFNKYIKSQNITRDFVLKVINNLKEETNFSKALRKLLEMDVRLVKVTSKTEVVNGDEMVYDFTVPETKNFVAERFIIHNTSILDAFRGSDFQREEAGGITQKISFTKYPIEQIRKACPLIEEKGIKLEIPGYLFIDTPGHAAFVNLRKRGGALADLAIVVISVKEGIKPQTAEVLRILKAHKTPFLIALNKVDTVSGWRAGSSFKESYQGQAVHSKQEFEEALLTFQASLREHGFDSALYYEAQDFTKQVAIVPCSAKTKEGIAELLFVLCGLCQKFLKARLEISGEAKGVILEMKKEKGIDWYEIILYDGELKEGDEIVVASFGESLITKVRSILEIEPLSTMFQAIRKLRAAAGARIQVTNKEGIQAGMPFQIARTKAEVERAKLQFKKEIAGVMNLDREGIIIKADSLGSLEALITLLKQERIEIVKAGIGSVSKGDFVSAKANLEINPLNALIAGFNVSIEEGVRQADNVKIITNDVVYKLIEEIQSWRKMREEEILEEKLFGLATICKLEILHEHVFRNSNPAIFGIRVIAGKVKVGIPLIDDKGEEVARVKSLQEEKSSVGEAGEGKELAIALPGIMFDRRLDDVKFLYSAISDSQFKEFRKNKDILSRSELKVLDEISGITGKEQV